MQKLSKGQKINSVSKESDHKIRGLSFKFSQMTWIFSFPLTFDKY